MTGHDAALALMNEIGPIADLLAVDQINDNAWRLFVDAATTIIVDYDDDADFFEFSMGLGRPDDAAKTQVYALLLQLNRRYADIGVILALDAAEDEVVLMHRRRRIDVTISELATIIKALAEKAEALAGVIAGRAPPHSASAPDEIMTGLIRC